MKRSYLMPVLLLLGSFLYAQAPDPLVVDFSNTINAEDVKAHITFLADDMMEGRETGERGQRLAAHYIRAHFQRIGLAPGAGEEGYFQPFYLNRTTVESGEMQINKDAFSYPEDFFSLGSAIPDEIPTDAFVYAGYGMVEDDYNNLAGLELRDKAVVIDGGSPEGNSGGLRAMMLSWQARAEAIQEAGASALLIMLPDSAFNVLGRFVNRSSISVGEPEETDEMGVIIMREAVGHSLLKAAKGKPEKLKASLAKSAEVPSLRFDKADVNYTANVTREKVRTENVLGYLEGTDKKDELLVLTAHYDHIGVGRNGEINNGADDDASGTTAILEVAEAFAIAAKEGHRPRRSLLFMTVSGEEKGLLGSAYYADNPVYPLENTVANLNIDMVGRVGYEYQDRPDSLDYVYLIGSDKLSSELHEISERSNATYTNLTLDYKYNDENDPNRFYYRSDHYNFAKNGIPVVFYFNGTHEDYHRPGDTVDKIKFGKIAKIGRLVFATAWELANRDERIKVDSNLK